MQFNSWLQQRRANHLYRALRLPAGIDFCSNDYLGLSQHPEIIQAAIDAAQVDGVGSTSSRLIRGEYQALQDLESEVALWQQADAALLCSSGWHANLSLFNHCSERDAIFSDALNHASLIDGIRLSKAKRYIFRHQNPEHLETLLRRYRSSFERVWIVSESIFSMDGTKAPIGHYTKLAEQYQCGLVIDEAHAVGLYADQGRGLAAHLHQHELPVFRVLTAGKALGCSGAFVISNQSGIDVLINSGRAFTYTTAVPPMTVGALSKAVALVQSADTLRQEVFQKASYLRSRLETSGWQTHGEGPIIAALIGDNKAALDWQEDLASQGFDVRAIRPPTVPRGTSRLRIVVHHQRSKEEIDALAGAMQSAPGIQTDLYSLKSAHAHTPQKASHLSPIVICGTDTDVGKTVASACIMRLLHHVNRSAFYLKPVQTGTDSDTQTVARLADLTPEQFDAPLFWYQRPASIDQATKDENKHLDVDALIESITQTFRRKAPQFRHMVLECAGGLRVPINDHQEQIDMLTTLGAPTILVARSGLGTLNHTLLSLEVAHLHGLSVKALVLIGERHQDNEYSLSQRIKLPLLTIPVFSKLTTDAIDTWVRTMDENQQAHWASIFDNAPS